jgi:hypothetical protein
LRGNYGHAREEADEQCPSNTKFRKPPENSLFDCHGEALLNSLIRTPIAG